MKRKDVIGVVVSVGVSVAGLLFAPRPHHGWGGVCPWEMVFPIYGSLWPAQEYVVFDGCDTSPPYLMMLAGYLGLVFLVAGTIASRLTERPSRVRGALVNAVVFACALLVLTLQADGGFSVLPTLVVGVATIAGAAGVGLLGGPRAKRA